jgi:hypothetical protein
VPSDALIKAREELVLDMFSTGRVIVDTNTLSSSQVCHHLIAIVFICGWLKFFLVQAGAAVVRLKGLMVEYFDELNLVSNIWDSVVLALSDRFAVSKHGRVDVLSMPHDAQIEGILVFLRKSGPLRGEDRE